MKDYCFQKAFSGTLMEFALFLFLLTQVLRAAIADEVCL